MKEKNISVTVRLSISNIENMEKEANRLSGTLTDIVREAINWYLAFAPETRDRIKAFGEQIRLPIGNILEPIYIDYLAKLHVELTMGKRRKLDEFLPRTEGYGGDDLFQIAVMHWQNELMLEENSEIEK